MSDNRTGYLGTNGTLQIGHAPDKWASITTTANSNVAAYTPSIGKKFRLLKAYIDVSGDVAAASAGPVTVSLLDGSTQMGIARTIYVPATAGTSPSPGLTIDLLPLGILSAAASNVLNVLLSKALTSGTVRVVVGVCEE